MRFTLLLSLIVVFCSCDKEPTTWDTTISAPLIRTSLGIEDLISDTSIESDLSNRAVLKYQAELFQFRTDSLVAIEPDSITKSFGIAPLTQFTFNPGQLFYSDADIFEIEGTTAELKEVILRAGIFKVRCSSTVDADLLLRVQLPKATRSGVSLDYSIIIPAGDNGNTSDVTDLLDLNDYVLDLTGANGFNFNELEVIFNLQIAPYETPTTVFNTDLVTFSIGYESLDIAFASGYLGSENYSFSETSPFIDFGIFNNAMLSLSEATLLLTVSNGFGVDIQAKIQTMRMTNSASSAEIDLIHPIVGGSINLGRASENYPATQPSYQTYLIDQTNSNIIDFLNFLGDSIFTEGQAKLNPFGNIGNYNDWISDQSALSAMIDASIPLTLSLNNLVISDTVAFDWNDEDTGIKAAKLYLAAKNSFPANASISIKALSNQYIPLLDFSAYSIAGSDLIGGSTGSLAEESLLIYDLDESAVVLLKQAQFLSISVNFITTNYPDLVTFEIDDRIDILISADLNTRNSIK